MTGVSLKLCSFSVYIEEKKRQGLLWGEETITKHHIVQPITANVPPSSLFAILGGSGSGKTTLLNAIAGRFDKKSYYIDGEMSFNKQRCSIGYVSQSDYLMPNLTVKETLLFTARLKVATNKLHELLYRSSASNLTHEDVVDEVILDLGLKECSNSRIGDDVEAGGKRGISGGEKRRVSVALQILTNPEVLCADEPTSGLDSFTAITLMESLQKLTKGPRKTTVLASIHQPRADVFAIFDNVLILSKGGYAVYCGRTDQMIDYFQRIGYECPTDANPADFFVDLSSVDVDDGIKKIESKERVKKLVDHFQATNIVEANQSAQESVRLSSKDRSQDSAPHHVLSWSQQTYHLLQRFALNNYRDNSNFFGGILQASILGIILMGIFWQLDDSSEGIESRSGLLYAAISMEQYILMIILVERYCQEVKILDRELLDELYSPSAYFIAHVISMIPQLFLQAIVYSIPIYFGCNLRHGFGYFVMFAVIMITLGLVINGLAWMCVSVQRIYSEASLLANFNFTFISLTAGFLVNYNTLPVYVTWVRYISFLSYAYRILMTTEFTDRTLDCTDDTACLTGNDVLNDNGIVQNDYQNTWPVLITIVLVYHLVAVISLQLLRFPPIGAVVTEILAAKEDENDAVQVMSYDKETRRPSNGDRANPLHPPSAVSSVNTMNTVEISISVVNVNLFVKQSHLILPATTSSPATTTTGPIGRKQILHDINLEIQPGKLVAIMGGSGSGKTTLLNLLANRIPHSCLRHSDKKEELASSNNILESFAPSHQMYHGSGYIHFNKRRPTSTEIRSAIGYVQQFDHHLPSLTVLETLAFHAYLRLPMQVSPGNKDRRVEEVLSTLGLQQCANIRVGSDVVKGISGGEKRRLSIGVQLLSDPSICLFDEPTTGLDAFTARHIVMTLKELTTPFPTVKKTIILSIHQPRYDIFACIDEVILLSRGQLVWSGSVAHMMQHFQSVGHACPTFTNPADFILDISSIDFRSPEKEQASRDTLSTLVSSFQSRFSSPDAHLEAGRIDEKESVLVEEKETETTWSFDSIVKPDYHTFPLLLSRSWMNLSRQTELCFTRISQGLFFALILCCFYAPVGHDQNSIQNRIGNLYELTALCFIGMLNSIAIYPSERNVFYREYFDGYYSARSFAMSYFVIAIPILVLASLGIAALMLYAIGLQSGAIPWIEFSYIIFCFMFVGECLGVMFCSAFQHVGFSLNIVSAAISIICIMAGFLSLSMPEFIRSISNISPTYWGAYILANIAFEDQTFTCSGDQSVNGTCAFTTGEQVLDLYDMNHGHLLSHYWILGIVTSIYWLLSLVALRLRAWKLSH